MKPLTLRTSDLDFGNLLVTAFGKGRKERRIPFLFELRKVLFRYGRVRLPEVVGLPEREAARRLGIPRSTFQRLMRVHEVSRQ